MVDHVTSSSFAPGLQRGRVLVALGTTALGVAVLRYATWLSSDSRFQDLEVYRDGATALWRGLSPYSQRGSDHGGLVFTYPPFAAVVFGSLAQLSWATAGAVLLIISAAAYVALVWSVGRGLKWSGRGIALAALLGLSAEPVLRTVQQGQVNLILAALVAVDLLVLPARYRGSLVGLAAGIKIIPAAFVLCLTARGDRRGAARAVAVAASTVAVTWLIAPQASRTYWLGMVFDTSRSGGGGYPDNQSLVGVLARLMHNDHPAMWLTLPLQALMLSLALLRAKQAEDREDHVSALILVAVGALLASPVSWSHHWVWCVPLIMLLVDRHQRVAAAVGTLVFSLSPLTLSPLGLLEDAPRIVWVPATALMPAFGLYWLWVGSRRRVGAGRTARSQPFTRKNSCHRVAVGEPHVG